MTKDNMYKILLIFLFVVFIIRSSVLAQVNSNDQLNPFKGIEILPPAPNSASLGRYGGINIGLNTGTMRHDIELLNFQSGKLSLPVSISYASNGIKVDEIASRVGMSWNLNAGGVITRTVRGEVDDSKQRLTNIPNFSVRNRAYLNFLETLSTPDGTGKYWDAEPDEFSYNFMGYSGKFVLDANFVPVNLTYNNLKIERSSTNSYTITTPDGVKYVFGGSGSNATETVNRYQVGSGCGRTYPNNTITGFYLKTITHPTGNTITFNYSLIRYQYDAGINASLYIRDTRVLPGSCVNTNQAPPSSNMTCLIRYDTNTPLLNEINLSTGGRITFSYVDRLDLGDKLIKTITAHYPNTAYNRTFTFDYLQQRAGQGNLNSLVSGNESIRYRPFLRSMIETDAQGSSKKHTFSYYTPASLSPRLSYAQDYCGFFNGQYNNVTFFQRPTEFSWQQAMPQATANRSVSETHTKIGLLSRIVYPSGGSDSILYENNTEWGSEIIPPPTVTEHLEVIGTAPNGIGTGETESITINENHEAVLVMGLSFVNVGGETDPRHQTGLFELTENDNVKISERLGVDELKRVIVNLRAGYVYKLKITASRGPNITASANFTYKAGASTTVYKNKIVAGARVSRVISESGAGQPTKIKKYTYSKLAIPAQSSGTATFFPIFHRYVPVFYVCPPGSGGQGGGVDCQVQEYKFYMTSSSTLYNVYQFGGAPVNYSHVIEEHETENGGTEYQFTVVSDLQGNQMLGSFMDAPTISNSDRTGREIVRFIFKRSGSQIVPLERVTTKYKEDSRVNREVMAYIGRKKYSQTCTSEPPSSSEFDQFDFLIYSYHQRWIYVDTILTELYGDNGAVGVNQTENYTYGNVSHALPTVRAVSNSDGSKEVTLTTYPDDYSNTGGFIGEMKGTGVGRHLIGYPVEQVRYREVGTVRTILWGRINRYQAGGRGLLDEVLQIETDAPIALASFRFSNRSGNGQLPPGGSAAAFSPHSAYKQVLKYNRYDSSGNPLQVTPATGPPVSYIWGHGRQYPVAEVRNVAYSVLETVFGAPALEDFSASQRTPAQVRTFLAPLRSHSSLSGGLPTVYSYDPLVGIRSVTDPSGRTVFYEYDGFGRLRAVKDHNNNLVESHDYRYRNQ